MRLEYAPRKGAAINLAAAYHFRSASCGAATRENATRPANYDYYFGRVRAAAAADLPLDGRTCAAYD